MQATSVKLFIECEKEDNLKTLKSLGQTITDSAYFEELSRDLYTGLSNSLAGSDAPDWEKFHNFVDKFNLVAMWILSEYPEHLPRSVALLDMLLYLLRKAREVNKDFSIGIALHNLGIIYGSINERELARTYVTLALVNDMLVGSRYSDGPAYKSLRSYFGISEEEVKQLKDIVDTYNNPQKNVTMPEDIYLEYLAKAAIDRRRIAPFRFDQNYTLLLLSRVKESSRSPQERGEALELLIAYLFMSNGKFEVSRNVLTRHSQLDLIVRNHSAKDDPILAELGLYILVECKNWSKKASAPMLKKFMEDISLAQCSTGILVTSGGITGSNRLTHARYIVQVMYHKRAVKLICLDMQDLENLCTAKTRLRDLLVQKYENIRFDKILAN